MLREKNIQVAKIIVTTLGIISALLLPNILFFWYLKKIIFVLPKHEVVNLIKQDSQQAYNKIYPCNLLPGDILLRRYITKRVELFEKKFHPYFTHSAIYIGNNFIIEAVGKEKSKQDEVAIIQLNKSDWKDDNIEDLVVIKQKNISLDFAGIKNQLISIANDPEYSFGLPKKNKKITNCSFLAYNQIYDRQLIKQPKNKIITPDYLLWYAKQYPENYSVQRCLLH
ncbi:MAG: hypothetical protein PHR00_04660 [Patescibacteria group bacterium]|nr:hypothetical protein [Patescibacteria group bacterium]